MLNTSIVIAFVATRQPDQAREFYENVLGLKVVNDEASALVFDAGGTQLRVSKVTSFTPASYTVLGWGVADIHTTIQHLLGKGVRFEQYEGLPQDESGVCRFPDGTQVAWFKDPDGNTLSLTQFHPVEA